MTTAGRDDPVMERLLGAAALVGPRFPLGLVARVLELDHADCLAAVDRAVRRGVLATDPDAGVGGSSTTRPVGQSGAG